MTVVTGFIALKVMCAASSLKFEMLQKEYFLCASVYQEFWHYKHLSIRTHSGTLHETTSNKWERIAISIPKILYFNEPEYFERKVVQNWNMVHLSGNFWDHGITSHLHLNNFGQGVD